MTHVTPDFLRPFASARFVIDHLEFQNGTKLWATAHGDVWTMKPRGAVGVPCRLDFAAFQALLCATPLPDGSFKVTQDLDDHLIEAGTVCELVVEPASAGLPLAKPHIVESQA